MLNTKIEALVDFCAYDTDDLQGVLTKDILNVKQYIYISSDSVYEVSSEAAIIDFSTEVLSSKDRVDRL